MMGEVVGEARVIGLGALRGHPLNCNEMTPGTFEKLKGHIERTGRYPPVVVRGVGGGAYEILDGHHRVRALRELGRGSARCVVWDVDDDEALVLLGTLNRLSGRDGTRGRARLIEELRGRFALEELAGMLPEGLGELEAMAAVREEAGALRCDVDVGSVPVGLHFFVLPGERDEVEGRLRAMGGTRESALLRLVRGG